MFAKNKENEIILTRIYYAAVKNVWDAFVDPKKAAQWWGPRGFTITTNSKDFKVGGSWDYIMHGPDGVDFPNYTTYLEIDQYKRMVYDHGGTKTTPPMFRVTVIFTELNGKTQMDMTMALPNAEMAKNIRQHIKKAGGDTCWDRLGEYLEKEIHQKDLFIINRSFNTDIQTMFKMWTDPKLFSQWLPPTGMTMEFKRADIRPGGGTVYKMTNGKDLTLYGRASYLEMEKPSHIKYTQQFIDKDEKISRHPLAPTWPETMLSNVEFHQEGQQKTRVTVKWEVYGACTKEELNVFLSARDGMSIGWTGSFDKLEELLAKS